MGKDFNIQSQEWLDLVFEGKNKSYGAYQIRQDSGRRNILALILVLALAVLLALLPLIISGIREAAARRQAADGITETTVLANLAKLEDHLPEENLIRQIEEIEVPKLKNTLQFTVPEVVPESELQDDREMKSQDEVLNSDTEISLFDVTDGSDDADAIDKATLLQQQTVIQSTPVDTPIRHPEQPAGFPGGDAALYKYLTNNMVFPQAAADNGVKGKVVVEFVVGIDGHISKAKVIRSLDPLCDEEALRVVKNMPKWNPARQNGKVITSIFTLPITFDLR